MLVDGGFLTGKVDAREIDEVVNDLFVALVDDSPDSRELVEEEFRRC